MRRGIAPVLVLTLVGAVDFGRLAPALGGDELPDARRGLRVTPLLLLSRADVRADLRLSTEQAADASRTIDDLRDKALELKGRNGDDVIAQRGRVDAASLAWIEQKLTPAQRERLVQLDLQWEGASAVITRSIVAGALSLTDAQRHALAKLVAEQRTRRQAGPPDPSLDSAFEATLIAQLDAAQQARWRELTGPPAPFRAGAAAVPATPVAARP